MTAKRPILLAFVQLTLLFTELFAFPAGSNIGPKVGVNHCVKSLGEHMGTRSGNDWYCGISAGFDILPDVMFNIAPQIKGGSYITQYSPASNFYYTNLYIPASLSVRVLPTCATSPYLGIGLGVNFQLLGKAVANDIGTETPIEDLEDALYFAACLGIEMKLKKNFTRFKISPEASFHYDLTTEEGDPHFSLSIYDFSLAVALCYMP
jgi:hypothetical protein